MPEKTTRCGLVALVGAPNVGKSSLLNCLVGEQVGIVSRKANTTRIIVRGQVICDVAQVIFVDTPGLNTSKKGFDRLLVQQARGALDDADVIGLVIDASRGFDDQAEAIIRQLKQEGGKDAVLILNKIDLVQPRSKLLELMTRAQAEGVFRDVFAVSTLGGNTTKSGMGAILPALAKMMPEGPWLFPADTGVTDMPLPFRLAEMTRGVAMEFLHEEIPYGMAVLPIEIEDQFDPMVVHQRILVSRDGHKGMVIGKQGQMLKRIGTKARAAMEDVLGQRVRLELTVVVDEDWFGRADMLRELGVMA